MERLTDFIDQAAFTMNRKGYNPREVDRFLEQMKDLCREWDEQYQRLEQEVQMLRADSTENGKKGGVTHGGIAG